MIPGGLFFICADKHDNVFMREQVKKMMTDTLTGRNMDDIISVYTTGFRMNVKTDNKK